MQFLPCPRLTRKSAIKTVFLGACAALLALFVPATLHASPITYNLTLTPSAGFSVGGTGTFTIEGAPVSSGISTYTVAAGNLDNLSFTLAGQTFTLPGVGNALVQFQNGQLWDITFAQELGTGTNNRYALHTTSNYIFYYDNEAHFSVGTFTATQGAAPSPVPEPTSLLLLTTGLLGGAALLYRRMTPQLVS